MIKANSLTYRTFKRQITQEVAREEVNYDYRLNMIDTFEETRITSLEAQELRIIIEPFKPLEETPTEPVTSK